MTKKNIEHYRIDYDKEYWIRYANNGFVEMPTDALDAIMLLCDEVERLRGWKKK